MKHSSMFVAFILFLAIVIAGFVSCDLFKKDNPVSPSGDDKIELGDEIQLHSSQTNAGSVVKVTKPGDPLDGMTITIPEGTFFGSRLFKMSSYEIKKHEFGQYVNPISSLIKITSTDGYADGIYELKIPVSIPQGSFPLVFIYDENLKKLEPLPVSNFDNSSVTITTRHFSTSSITGSSVKKDLPLLQSTEAYSMLFVSSMQESLIKQTPVISSGFKPGVDDWEFVNRGSYISPRGHCAGQNMAAFWYYYENKLKGEAGLFGLLKKHPTLWQDNNRGYRFCSVLQEDIDWEGMVKTFFRNYIDKNQELDKMKFYMIAGAMLVTGEPQYIGIARQIGVNNDGTPDYSGHALICYQIEPATGKLLISDPNIPAIGQSISFDNDKFLPYQGKQNADDVVNAYPFITYNAKTALIDWNQISKRWKEVQDYKIGDVSPNKFPAYQLWSPDKGGFEITDEININSDTLFIRVKVPDIDVGITINGEKYGHIKVYTEAGTLLTDANVTQAIFFRWPGSAKFGIEIIGYRQNRKDDNGNYIPQFIDFKWITVNYSKFNAKIIPNNMTGEAGKEFTWNLDVSNLPNDLKYYIKWTFGDNSPEERKVNVNFITHTYSAGGDYKIIAKLYNANDNKLIAFDTATAEIQGNGGISPVFGPAGQRVTITGKGFGNTKEDADKVELRLLEDSLNLLNHTTCLIKSWSDTKIEVIVLPIDGESATGKFNIKVLNYDYQKKESFRMGPWAFELVPLQVNTIVPDTVSTNSLMAINGSGFGQKSLGDTVLFGSDNPTKEIISWTNNKIVCRVNEMDSDRKMYIDVVKSDRNKFKYPCGIDVYWRSQPSDITTLLKRVAPSLSSSSSPNISFTADVITTYYDSKGDSTVFESKNSTYLSGIKYSKENIFSFTSNGTEFQSSEHNPNNDEKLTFSGRISVDGKILENLTATKYIGENLLLRVKIKDLPLSNYIKYTSKFNWEYSVESNANPYIEDFYVALYNPDGKLHSYNILKNATKIACNLYFTYK